MRITAITNQKGGTGKTSTAINLGSALSKLGKKTLLVDLDPQANLTYSFGIHTARGTIAEVLQESTAMPDILVNTENLYIAPSSVNLINTEDYLHNKIGREIKLKKALSEIKNFDYVLIDCPPALSILTVNALCSADEVLIPLQMEVLSLQGLAQLVDTIKEVKRELNPKLKIRGIVPSMFDKRRRLTDEVLNEIKNNMKLKVFKTVIRECVKIAEAPSFAQSVLVYAPKSNGAIDYMNLAREFIREGG